MASFKDLLTKPDVEAIKAYVLEQSHLAWDQAHPKKPAAPGAAPVH